MGVESRSRELLSYCCKHGTKKELWGPAIAEIVAFGSEAVPFLVDEVISQDWDRAGWAACALGDIGAEAIDAVPALFSRMQDAQDHQEDMFGLNAYYALVHIGMPCLRFMRQKALSLDSRERHNAFDIMLQILPRDRETFEYFKDRLVNGDEQDQSFLICQLDGFTDFRDEALELISSGLHSNYTWVRYYSAKILSQLRANGELADKHWDSALDDPDPEIRKLVLQAYTAHSTASDTTSTK
jgi:hypothetical protein